MKRLTLNYYLALALPLQIDDTHVHNGAKVGERLHHSHKRALIVAVDVELQWKIWSDQISKTPKEKFRWGKKNKNMS